MSTELLHDGLDKAILAVRHELYIKARERNPRRWSGNTRDWSAIRSRSAMSTASA